MDPEKLKKSTTTDGRPPAPGYENASAPQPVGANGQHGAYWVLMPARKTKPKAVRCWAAFWLDNGQVAAICTDRRRLPTVGGSIFYGVARGTFVPDPPAKGKGRRRK